MCNQIDWLIDDRGCFAFQMGDAVSLMLVRLAMGEETEEFVEGIF
jgi:hypothetical protein